MKTVHSGRVFDIVANRLGVENVRAGKNSLGLFP
jgi:hypothetical protein